MIPCSCIIGSKRDITSTWSPAHVHQPGTNREESHREKLQAKTLKIIEPLQMQNKQKKIRGCSNILRSYFGPCLTQPPPKMIALLSNCDHIWALAGPSPFPRSDSEIFEQPLIEKQWSFRIQNFRLGAIFIIYTSMQNLRLKAKITIKSSVIHH